MKLKIFAFLVAASLAPSATWAQNARPIQASFFGMHGRQLNDSPPLVSFGAFRFWDTGTRWTQIEPEPGKFDWTHFDKWVSFIVNDHNFRGSEAVFVLGPGTPEWASSDSDDTKCDYYNEDHVPGQCYPPKDVAKDGSGTDQIWKDWVTAVATHAAASRIHVKYWEVWNEFNDQPNDQSRNWEWAGTPKQLARLAEDTRCVITGRGRVRGTPCTAKPIDASAVILSPSLASKHDALHLKSAKAYFDQPGAADAAEEIAYHNYTVSPEDVTDHTRLILSILPASDRTKQLISTEGGWHDDCQLPDLQEQASFVAREYLMLNTSHVTAHYWYNWFARGETGWSADLGFGTLWNPDGKGKCTSREPGITPAGVAYQQIYNWMVGAAVSPCVQDGSVKTVYTCSFSRDSDYSGVAIWDSSQTCNNHGCSTREWPVPPGMTWFRDLAGNLFEIEGTTVKIGLRPILLENKRR
jgi:hypothetical protein